MLTVPGSALRVVRRIGARPRAVAITGSLLFHAALASAFIDGALGSGAHFAQGAAMESGPRLTLALVRLTPSTAPASDLTTAPDGSTPARLQLSAPPETSPPPAATSFGPSGARSKARAPATGDDLAAALSSAPDPTPAADRATDEDETVAAEYRRRLLGYIEQFKHYPDEAASRPQAGEVQLAFELTRSGRVLDLRVEHSSGSRLLDAAAVETLRRADPLPSIPDALPDELSIELPVHFSAANGL